MENKVDPSGHIPPESTFTFTVTETHHKTRVDRFLADQFPLYSRSFLKKKIKEGNVTINGAVATKSGAEICTDDSVVIFFPAPKKPDLTSLFDGSYTIDIIHENDHFLIVNKPAGLVVHRPSKLSTEPSLADWITHKYEEVKDVGHIDRPGIVHRLDKDTSGLMIIPRTNYAHNIFGQMFKDRNIHKTYLAIVKGHPDPEGTIDMPIGRHPTQKIKMAPFKTIENHTVRKAVTHYKVLEYFEDSALVEVKPVTGRTHQIRVHFAAIGHPLIGDQVYGTASKFIPRHALHAQALEFEFDKKPFSFSQKAPEDFQKLLALLKK